MSGLEKWRLLDHLSIKEYDRLKESNKERGAKFELSVRWRAVGKKFGLRFYMADAVLFEEIAHYTDIVHVAIEAQFKLQDLILEKEKEFAKFQKDQEPSWFELQKKNMGNTE